MFRRLYDRAPPKALRLYDRIVHQSPVFQYLEELQSTQWRSPDEVQALQWQKLKDLITHAYANVPWYRQHWRNTGFHPADLKSYAEFEKLPLLNKQDVQACGPALEAANYRGRNTCRNGSSGSTGVAVTFVYPR